MIDYVFLSFYLLEWIIHQTRASDCFPGPENMITLLWLHSSAYLLFSSVDMTVPLHSENTAAQDIPHKLSQILFMLSILLLLIPLHCLFISALSCMGKLDWFGSPGWETAKVGGARQSVRKRRINSDTDKWLRPDRMNHLTFGTLQWLPLRRVALSCLFCCMITWGQAHLSSSGTEHRAGANNEQTHWQIFKLQ